MSLTNRERIMTMKPVTLDTLKELLASDQPKKVILDTDAYNEVDDQFCIAYCMRAKEKIDLLSINAAPFLNRRSTSPADGMEQSYNEIFKIMRLVDPNASIPVYRGSAAFMTNRQEIIPSPAATNIIETVKASEEPVIIIAIGAITNVASALLQCPELAHHCAVIWLGGHAHHYPHAREFNLREDIPAAQVVFDSGVPLLQVPCCGVCSEFVTSVPELEYYLRGKNKLCDYLVDNVSHEIGNRYAASRIIWDVTAAAPLICPAGCDIVQLPTPILTSEGRYAFDTARHPYLYVRHLNRDRIYADLFQRLSE